MITKMKKYTFLIYHKEYEDFLLKIRDLGVVHIEQKQEGQITTPELQEKFKLYSSITSAESYLQNMVDKKYEGEKKPASVERGIELSALVDKLRHSSEKKAQQLQSLQKEIDSMEPWGEFDYDMLQKLKNAGYKLHFYISATRDFKKEWVDDLNAVIINNTGSHYYFVVVTRNGEEPDIDVERAKLSHASLAGLRQEYETVEEEKNQINEELKEIANSEIDSLQLAKDEILSEIEFSTLVLGGDRYANDKLLMLQGWIPIEKEGLLRDFLDKEHHFYEEEMLTPKDNVPILLKNNAFSRLYEPITEMFSLPNYTELDPTPLFAPFFMLFFGLCMGDAGYGLIIFVACLLAKRKVPKKLKGLCTLGAILGVSTMIVGLLTGSFFGIALDSVEWPWLKGVKDYFITEANYAHYFGGYNPLMVFAVVIGIVQILFGMCVNAVKITKQFGIKYAYSKIAWIVGLVTAAVTFGLPLLGIEFPALITYILYGILGLSVLCIFLYNTPDKGVFLNVGSGLWDTYNMATGLLGDTLSYIRLFALGLTGSILGGVFNTLAFDLTSSFPAVAQFFAAFLILIVGHAINFGLCLIGAFVHPMRLTFVEFYKNAGFEGGGKAYKPFRK